MMKMFSKKMKNQKGFTLVELIVVIAIIGILGAIAVPRFGGFTEKAKVAADEQLANVIANAAILYAADNDGVLPADATTAILSSEGLIEKAYAGSDLKSDKYGVENATITISKPGTNETGTVKVVIGGTDTTNSYTVYK